VTTKTSHSTEELQVLAAQALHAYELALAMRLLVERQGQQEQQLSTLQKQQQTALMQIETNSRREEMETTAKKECVEQLLAAIEQIEKASRDLLMQLDKSSSRSGGEVVTTGFFTAQLAYIDLRALLLRLAMAFLDVAYWEESRRVARLLLEDLNAPFYIDANALLCETYYKAAEVAVREDDLSRAAQDLQQLAKINSRYKKTLQRVGELFARLADNAKWDLAAQLLIVMEDIGAMSIEMRQRLDSTKELQAAMTAIKAIELLWSTTIKLPATLNWDEGTYGGPICQDRRKGSFKSYSPPFLSSYFLF